MSMCWLVACLAGLPASDRVARLEPPGLKELTELAARHQIPMPPMSARLVLVHTQSWHQLQIPSTGGDPGIYSPAFLLEEKSDGSAIVLLGTERRTIPFRLGEPSTRKFSLDRVKGTRRGYETRFADLSTFVCAVQVAAREDLRAARGLMERFAEDNPDRLKNAPLLLADCAYDYQRRRLMEGSATWRDVRVRMAALFDEFPKLRTRERRELLRDLAATLGAKPPKAGSVEALVLDWAGQPGGIDNYPGWELFRERGSNDSSHTPARQIALRGFEAIPDLIALIEDRRVTSREVWGRNPSMFRTGEMAACLLTEIVGHGTNGAQPWQQWWENARKGNERDYFNSAVFLKRENRITRVSGTVAHIIASKWPEDLPRLCEQYTALAGPDVIPSDLAEALAEARMPKDERVKALESFASRGSLDDRRFVLLTLARLDSKKAAEILLPLLDKIPKDATGEAWLYRQPYFAQLVLEIDDDGIWKEYLRIVRLSSIGLRVQTLGNVGFFPSGDKHRARRIAFLAAFLDDEAVRDASSDPKAYAFPSAASEFARIAVRDFAAVQIATILGFNDAPDRDWDAGQWAKLREKVRLKLSDERLPNLGPGK